MNNSSKSWIILAIIAGLASWTTAQQAVVPTRHVNTKAGSSANFTCESQGTLITSCIWEVLPSPGATSTPTTYLFPGSHAGYSLVGDGLDKGQCGLRIERVKESDNGIWQCTLIAGGELLRGQVHVNIIQKPGRPEFRWEPKQAQVIREDDAQQKITCYSTNGVPKPKLMWFIDNEQIVKNLGPLNETNVTGNNGAVISYTFQDLFGYKFTFKDNGKKLRCVAIHEAFDANDKSNEVETLLNIQYRPRSIRLDGSENERGIPITAELGQDALIFLNITSYPQPSKAQWTVDGKVIVEGSNSDKYEAIPKKNTRGNIYQYALKIKSLDEEDVKKSIALRITNDAGSTEYTIGINSTDNGSDGLSAGGILGIVLGLLVLIILVAVIVVYTRAKGLLCFKGDDGTASEKERMDEGSTGGGAAVEEKPQAVGLKSRLNAFCENLMKKKDKGTPVPDEEAPKEKDGKEKEGEDGKEPEKKGDDIVYAELDHARSAAESRPEVVVRSDDKTEYAEIVGVVSKDDKSQRKTPEASPKK